ncbi:hypothetical protein CEY00_Acc16632 [Actinidia chinensis var. chinensis]|uniref:Uncharacterized protein n=1 Tax=Actinidia chinensis var. chinensis TaxID=1590841 RepID=A0A2R6QJN4_ACTCC|nr:hypothetical protein CEY00_Acc16632 [Actinidia chinensis var. chinensis]
MLKRGGITISLFSSSTVVVGWCRTRRRLRRRKGSTVRLGNKRRGFFLRCRPVVHWEVVLCPFRMLKKIIMDMTKNGRLMDTYYWSLPIFRPQLFPLC